MEKIWEDGEDIPTPKIAILYIDEKPRLKIIFDDGGEVKLYEDGSYGGIRYDILNLVRFLKTKSKDKIQLEQRVKTKSGYKKTNDIDYNKLVDILFKSRLGRMYGVRMSWLVRNIKKGYIGIIKSAVREIKKRNEIKRCKELLSRINEFKQAKTPKELYDKLAKEVVWGDCQTAAAIFVNVFNRGRVIEGIGGFSRLGAKHIVWEDNDGKIYDPILMYIGSLEDWKKKFNVRDVEIWDKNHYRI